MIRYLLDAEFKKLLENPVNLLADSAGHEPGTGQKDCRERITTCWRHRQDGWWDHGRFPSKTLS